MKKFILVFLLISSAYLSNAQKRMLSYPFEFEKSFLEKSDYDAYFLNNTVDNNFALVLQDNKKAEYVLVDKGFKTVSKVSVALGSSALDKTAMTYIGGTADGHVYHFIYGISSKHTYDKETVDFDSRSVTHQKLFELPRDQKHIVMFNSDNKSYFIAADDDKNELVIYTMNAKGQLDNQRIPFAIPATAGKVKLSTYLGGIRVFKEGEDPDLSAAVRSRKLFVQPGRLQFIINYSDDPTHIFSISLPDMKTQEKFIDYDAVVGKDEKGKVYISSFMESDYLYSLVLNKKNIRITIHDLKNNALLTKYEINAEVDNYNLFAVQPVTEIRRGGKESAKDVDDIKKVIKAFTRGSEGVMVTRIAGGKILITAGTYDLVPMSTGGSSGMWNGGTRANFGAGGATLVYTPFMYYTPGLPSYTSVSARYYTTTYFKCLVDPGTFKPARARVPEPLADQIKDYMETVDKKARATRQFSIGKDQFYGYYDKDMRSYIIEQIRIF